MLIGKRIVTSKMSCAQVIERGSCVLALSETNTKEEAKELLDLVFLLAKIIINVSF
jgi:hypothetical protein